MSVCMTCTTMCAAASRALKAGRPVSNLQGSSAHAGIGP